MDGRRIVGGEEEGWRGGKGLEEWRKGWWSGAAYHNLLILPSQNLKQRSCARENCYSSPYLSQHAGIGLVQLPRIQPVSKTYFVEFMNESRTA